MTFFRNKDINFIPDQLLVSKDPYEYKSICQGVVTVDNLDDAAELLLTDVRFVITSDCCAWCILEMWDFELCDRIVLIYAWRWNVSETLFKKFQSFLIYS